MPHRKAEAVKISTLFPQAQPRESAARAGRKYLDTRRSRLPAELLAQDSYGDSAGCTYCGCSSFTRGYPAQCYDCAHKYPLREWAKRGDPGWYVAIPGRDGLSGPWPTQRGAAEEAEFHGGAVYDFTDESRILAVQQALDQGGPEEVMRAINGFLRLRRATR